MSLLITIEDLSHIITPNMRLMGLDLGSKTIGLAVATLSVALASRFTTIRRTKFQQDAQVLLELIEQEKIDALVLGLPLNMDGTEGPRAQSTRAFVRNLKAFAPPSMTLPPVMLWDERLSSVAADETMMASGLSRAKRADRIDAVAAQIILQGAINKLLHVYDQRVEQSESLIRVADRVDD